MKACKICMIGDFAVGKTSLVSRFVHQCFDQRYQTTVGVRIDTAELTLPSGDHLKLVLWDIAGRSDFADITPRYLEGSAGYLLVADGTRRETLAGALGTREAIRRLAGDLPFCLLLNKRDQSDTWQLDDAMRAPLATLDHPVLETSALDGSGVAEAFQRLGAQLVHRL